MNIGNKVQGDVANEILNSLWEEVKRRVPYDTKVGVYREMWEEIENEVEYEVWDKINIG